MSTIPAGVWCVCSDAAPTEFGTLGAVAAAAGAAALTLRRPSGSDDAILQSWRALAPAWRAVHARADWAEATESAAVIAGVRSAPVAALRRDHPQLRIGASVHDLRAASAARDAGADFLLFGPVWATPAKQGVLEPRGLDALASVCALGLEVVAIGGVLTPTQVQAARAVGAHACAVLRAAREPQLLARLVAA